MVGNVPYFIPAYTECRSASITPSKPAQMRLPLFEGLPSSVALHRVQSQPSPQSAVSSSATRLRQRQVKREDRVKKDQVCRILNTCSIVVEKESTHQCLVEGCGKRFKRREHLKRHERTHANTESFICEFCRKIFNRSDNLKQHLKIHMNPKKKAARTDYYPEARLVFEAMSSKKRRNQSSRS
ncbi:hypothetical protein BJ875DRAFT_463215 [Amylocarpus encephaloides]|uniref:C2H2-type domain-containing protein n=1 Tax=Amylocarpus encephaloides TaxID=45428 RepID=A0A9P7YHY5_9HELO|nr:hypothetical protein BJ875DRAFT_463215 [Amylocarpus encephaloides]